MHMPEPWPIPENLLNAYKIIDEYKSKDIEELEKVIERAQTLLENIENDKHKMYERWWDDVDELRGEYVQEKQEMYIAEEVVDTELGHTFFISQKDVFLKEIEESYTGNLLKSIQSVAHKSFPDIPPSEKELDIKVENFITKLFNQNEKSKDS